MTNWFVYFVITGREEYVCRCLNEIFSDDENEAFVPKIETVYRSSQKVKMEIKPMFPGYVFVDSVHDGRSFLEFSVTIKRNTKDIIKLLGQDGCECMPVDMKTRDMLMSFFDKNRIIEMSKGFIVGDRVYITSGPLEGRESTIRWIDRHKRKAIIDTEFFGTTVKTFVPLEIVEKM